MDLMSLNGLKLHLFSTRFQNWYLSTIESDTSIPLSQSTKNLEALEWSNGARKLSVPRCLLETGMGKVGCFYFLLSHLFISYLSFFSLISWSRPDMTGWLGRAMILGTFQCQGVLLLWHIVGQGPAVLIAGAGLSFSNASSLGRRLDRTEILWSWLL